MLYHGFVFVLFFVKILDHTKYITFFVSLAEGFGGGVIYRFKMINFNLLLFFLD
jgi:hypothetical protein